MHVIVLALMVFSLNSFGVMPDTITSYLFFSVFFVLPFNTWKVALNCKFCKITKKYWAFFLYFGIFSITKLNSIVCRRHVYYNNSETISTTNEYYLIIVWHVSSKLIVLVWQLHKVFLKTAVYTFRSLKIVNEMEIYWCNS